LIHGGKRRAAVAAHHRPAWLALARRRGLVAFNLPQHIGARILYGTALSQSFVSGATQYHLIILPEL